METCQSNPKYVNEMIQRQNVYLIPRCKKNNSGYAVFLDRKGYQKIGHNTFHICKFYFLLPIRS